jgi:serine protease Do
MNGSFRSTLTSGAVAGAIGLFALLLSVPPISAVAPPRPKEPLPAVLEKLAPVGAEDLKTMQMHVKKVLQKVMPATVGIRLGMSAGSGVIIDGEGHVLTAGHVSGAPNRSCTVILPNGKELKARTLGQNTALDSGMIKILDKPEKGKSWYHVEMGNSSKLKAGQWCLAIGQPGGFRPGRTPVVRLGRVLTAGTNVVRSDCTLVGGDSGGPLFDMDGKVIGIHSRIGPDITANIHVPVNTYRDTWDRLVKGESWSGSRRASAGYIGISFERGKDDLVITEVTESTGAAKAGLKVGDIVAGIDGKKLTRRGELAMYMESKKVNDEVILEILRDDTPMTFKIKLGRRPAD